jgi:hypothetical protein
MTLLLDNLHDFDISGSVGKYGFITHGRLL